MLNARTSGLLIAALLALTAGFLVNQYVNGASRSTIGQQRVDFTLPDLDGKTHHLSEWDGKIIIVNFWATWCPPCRKEIPDFVQLQEKYGAAGVQFVGVAVDQPEAIRDFIKTQPLNYPILVGDEEGSISKQFGNNIGALPYTAVIDRTGKINVISRGQFHRAEAETAIKELLSP